MIEWADRAKDLIPDESIKVLMQVVSPMERRIEIALCGANHHERFFELSNICSGLDNL